MWTPVFVTAVSVSAAAFLGAVHSGYGEATSTTDTESTRYEQRIAVLALTQLVATTMWASIAIGSLAQG